MAISSIGISWKRTGFPLRRTLRFTGTRSDGAELLLLGVFLWGYKKSFVFNRKGRLPPATGLPIDYIFQSNDLTGPLQMASFFFLSFYCFCFFVFFCLDIFFWFLRGLRPNTVAGNPSIIRRSDSRVDASVHYLFSVIRKKRRKKNKKSDPSACRPDLLASNERQSR